MQNMTENDNQNDKYIIKIASKRIEKELDSLPQNEYNKVKSKIKALASNPLPIGIKKLSEKVHRIRIGNYRVIYSIFDKEKLIIIAAVKKRAEDTYK